ncbi:hypothetical protein [Phnomibacter sp. MR]|uniref:hypothetical protein n=1 Tax=Phnomibacter sp. MR TaxID=3042318 RepID=UPI003A808F18
MITNVICVDINIKRNAILIILFFLIGVEWNTLNAQCSVKKDTYEELVVYNALNEKIYENEDYENGYKMLFLQSTLIIKKGEVANRKYLISILYGKSGIQPELVPRRVEFTLVDGRVIRLDAIKYDRPVLGKSLTERCQFEVSANELNTLKNFGIKVIIVSDTRTGIKMEVKPYVDLVKEQLNCLDKEN